MSWSWKGFWGDDPVYRFNCGPDFFHAGRSKVLEETEIISAQYYSRVLFRPRRGSGWTTSMTMGVIWSLSGQDWTPEPPVLCRLRHRGPGTPQHRVRPPLPPHPAEQETPPQGPYQIRQVTPLARSPILRIVSLKDFWMGWSWMGILKESCNVKHPIELILDIAPYW